MQITGGVGFAPSFGSLGGAFSGPSASGSGADEFRAAAKVNPMERMREQILKSMGMTEDSLNSMSADQRQVIEKTIADEIANRMKVAAEKKGQLIDISA